MMTAADFTRYVEARAAGRPATLPPPDRLLEGDAPTLRAALLAKGVKPRATPKPAALKPTFGGVKSWTESTGTPAKKIGGPTSWSKVPAGTTTGPIREEGIAGKSGGTLTEGTKAKLSAWTKPAKQSWER
jgi:hypothetical protein